MIDHYQAFLEAPSREGFLKLQEEVQAEADFCAAGGFVDQLADFCQGGRYEQMFDLTELMPFAWVASPSAHLYASIAAQQMGCPDDAELERFLTETMLEGLLETGDGSLEHPYQITYLSDRQDLLAYFSLDCEKQHLVRSPQGMMDVVTATTGDQICFLLSSSLTNTQLAGRQPVRIMASHPRLASEAFGGMFATSRLTRLRSSCFFLCRKVICLMPVACVIFDLDGTLVDSETLGSQVLLEQFPELDDTIESISDRYRGWRMANILADIEQRIGRKLPENFEHDYRDHAAIRLEEGLRPMPGVREMLQQLTLPRCVASNAPAEKMALALRVCGLSEFFDDKLFSCYDVGAWKPDPKIFRHACQAMDFTPEQCVVIEDSDVGVAAAVAAGIDVLRYDPAGRYQSSAQVQCFDQMASLLGLIAQR